MLQSGRKLVFTYEAANSNRARLEAHGPRSTGQYTLKAGL